MNVLPPYLMKKGNAKFFSIVERCELVGVFDIMNSQVFSVVEKGLTMEVLFNNQSLSVRDRI